tara:strand:+ start:2125 stop:2397 length:273 start_codon:yes stop_codon:yes gene_type:complete
MKDLKRFDRHAEMTSETRTEILNLIREFNHSGLDKFDLVNVLYGLYDGYFYETLLNQHQVIISKVDKPLAERLKAVIETVSSYPEIIFEQ